MSVFLVGMFEGVGFFFLLSHVLPEMKRWWTSEDGWPENLRWKLDILAKKRRLRKHQWEPRRLVEDTGTPVGELLARIPDLPEDWREWFPSHMCQVWDLQTFRDEDWKRAA